MQSEFDDHIKKQVDGFKLSPSPQVWNLVEAQLPEKKRRRFIFWWLPLGILLIGFGIYEFGGNNKLDKKIEVGKTRIKVDKVEKKDSMYELAKIKKTTKTQNKEVDKILKKRGLNRLNKKNSIVEIVTILKKDIKGKIFLNDDGGNFSDKKFFNLDRSLIPKSDLNRKNNEIDINTTITKENSNNKAVEDSQVLNKSVDSTTTGLFKKVIKIEEKDTSLIKTNNGFLKQHPQKAKWQLIAEIGSSNTVEFSSKSNSTSNYSSLPNSGITTPGNTISQASLSAPSSGISFGINLQRTKQIDNKLSWYGSIGYNYLSNHQASGSRVDSSKIVGGDSAQFYTGNNSRIDKVASYYKYGNSINNRNYVHLLSISVGLKYNISKAFSINGGIGLGYQFSSKWLQPDINKSVLYYSDKLTNKWNVGTKVGIDWQFSKHFTIGGFYNYSFSKASLATVQQNLHWQIVGATFSIQLPF